MSVTMMWRGECSAAHATAQQPVGHDEHGRTRLYVRDVRRPHARGEDIAGEQSGFVVHAVRDAGETGVGVGDAGMTRLQPVYAAAERPAAVRESTVVDAASAAEETFSAKGLHAYRDAVAGAHAADCGADFFDHAHSLVPDDYAGDGAGHGAVHYVQVAGADRSQSYADDGVAVLNDGGTGTAGQKKFVFSGIDAGKHIYQPSLRSGAKP